MGTRQPAVIVEAPVEGASGKYCALQCLAISADSRTRCSRRFALSGGIARCDTRLLSNSCRYPINKSGVGHGLGTGTRGVGSESSAAAIWGVNRDDYIQKADPYPLNPDGELLLGIKIENVRGASNIEQILSMCPALGLPVNGAG